MADSLLDNAKVEIVVPQTGAVDFQNKNQKTVLLLDEIVNVFVIFHTSVDEAAVQSQLSRLSITVEALATGTPRRALDQQQQGLRAHPQIRESVAKGSIKPNQNNPTISTSGPVTSISWSTELHIDHTRITTTSPTLTFSATLSLSLAPTSQPQPQDEEDEYLTPGVPVASENLLAALAQSSTFADSPNPPYLPASRLHRGSSVPRQRPLQSRMQVPSIEAVSTPFKLQPAVLSRLRTLHLGTAPNVSKVLANVEVEVDRNVEEAELEKLEVILENGKVNQHGQERASIDFPRTLKKGDVMSLAYTLLPGNDSSYSDHKQQRSVMSKAEITLIATVHPGQRGTSAPIKIRSRWFAHVDFRHKPSAWSEKARSTTTIASSQDHLITLTASRASSYPSPLTPGRIFRWHLLLANHSTTRTLNLAIIPITPTANPTAPRDWSATLTASAVNHAALTSTQRTDAKPAAREQRGAGSQGQATKHTTLPTWLYASASTHPRSTTGATSTATAPAALQSTSITNIESSSTGTGTGTAEPRNRRHVQAHGHAASPTSNTPRLLTTTPDVRLGPLPPGASTTAEVEFVVLGGTGSGGVEALRVVDLESERREGRWRWVDVQGKVLPGVFVFEDQDDEVTRLEGGIVEGRGKSVVEVR